ncbi:MAG: hypothetical protein ACR2NZ_22700 [Rubripirellula sp.]
MRMTLWLCMWVFVSHPFHSHAEAPEYPTKTSPERAAELKSKAWIDVIAKEVPPLKNESAGHMPMIMWHGVGFQPLTPEQIEVLRARGLCQHLQLSEHMIPAAKRLAEAGMPVILMEGRTDSWPYSLKDTFRNGKSDWAHDFDVTYQPPWFGSDDSSQWHGACPNQIAGWEVLARDTKRTMTKFRDAGVQVDAVWVDYEGDPYPWGHLFEQLSHCKRCRQTLPAEIIQDRAVWRSFAWQKYVALYDQYFAQAVREVFPDALVTNWHVVFSSEKRPVRYFARDVDLPALRPTFFNATNPIAYGTDVIWHQQWDRSADLTRASVDQFYRQRMLQQVQADRFNRVAEGAENVASVPWVARVCKLADASAPAAPMMSRPQYRECLAELWGEEIHTMQIFNAMHDGFEELAIEELQDAVAAYDQMLATQTSKSP